MYPISDRFRAALKESHDAVAKLVAIDGGGNETVLPVTGGYVDLILDATVRRGLSATVIADGVDLAEMRATLSPYTSRTEAYRGIRFADGTTEFVPLGTFYATSIRQRDDQTFEISGLDASSRAQNGLAAPHFIAADTNTAEAIPPLIGRKLPTVEFNLMPTNYLTPPLLLREGDDVWDEARKLALATGCDLFFDRTNICTSQPRVQSPDRAVWDFVEGVNADFWATERGLDADAKPNVVIVRGTTSRASVRGEAADMDATSPTYRYGDYGEKVYSVESSRVTNNAQATDMAKAVLQRMLGPSDEVTFSTIPNPALDPSDTVKVTRERLGLADELLVSRAKCPLIASESMEVTCRRYVVTEVT